MKTVFPTENDKNYRFGLSVGTDFSYCKIYVRKRIPCQNICPIHTTRPRHVNNLAPLQINILKTFSLPDRAGGISEEFIRKWKPECTNTIFPIISDLSAPLKVGAPDSCSADPSLSLAVLENNRLPRPTP
jgi:hypothetical protein